MPQPDAAERAAYQLRREVEPLLANGASVLVVLDAAKKYAVAVTRKVYADALSNLPAPGDPEPEEN